MVLTGAGISVPSGLATFRGEGGFYEGAKVRLYCTAEGFAENPLRLINWWLEQLVFKLRDALPNAGHFALAELEKIARSVVLVTSNVDTLHEQAGSSKVYRLHGNISETRCLGCKRIAALTIPEKLFSEPPRCDCGSLLRPNIVFFGEYPSEEAVCAANEALKVVDVVLEVGHSGVVHYGFSHRAIQSGILLVRVNPDCAEEPGVLCLQGSADIVLSELVAQL